MTDAPTLTLAELRQEVERIFRRAHRSRLVALYGTGEAAEFDLGGDAWRVVPTGCELELRERLPRPGERSVAGTVYLVDWARDGLPLDVSCRLAGGRLYHVARGARLAALFGAREVEEGLAGSALAKLILTGAVGQPKKVQGLILTRDHAWRSLLAERMRLPEEALASAGALLGWAAASEAGPVFARMWESDDLWRNARRELLDWLETKLGEPSGVVWRAWEQGLAARLLELLPLLEAAGDADPALQGQLRGQLSAWLPSLANDVRQIWTMLVEPSFVGKTLPSSPAPLLRLMERSQQLAEGAGLGALAAHSGRLPGGHAARERALADKIDAFVGQPAPEQAEEVLHALRALEQHGLDQARHPEPATREARRSLGRLALWLARRPAPGPAGTRWQPAVELAQRYSEEGGHLEWARQQVRGLRGVAEALAASARALLVAVDTALHADHRSFAEAYVAWVEVDKPASTALPIEQVGKAVIAPFLRENPRRKLLVVLMDGMGQAAAVQVLSRLAAARRWGPIAWRKDGWRGALPLPPVLAVAPTLTELSRGALFAGRADPRFHDEGTGKDPERWRSNRALADLLGESPPDLVMRSALLSGHDLSTDIRDAIKGNCRAVAVVVNAIDEDLKSSVQVAKDYSQVPVLALDALLSAAEEGERVVLLVADHGHVLGDGARTLHGRLGGGRPGGPRWRALAQDEAPAPEEAQLPASSWVPSGWHRIAALWDPAVVNRSAKYGEHGGVSLAEVVAPAILIAPDWLERAYPDDPGLAVRPLPTPDWWSLRVRRAPAPPAAAPAAPELQTALFVAPSQPAPSTPTEPTLIGQLRRSSVFRDQVQGQPVAEVERVLTWLGALASAGDAMPAADFAAAAGVRAHQVAGAVARMGLLNADGFAMIEHDHTGRRVVLHRARPAQHYGIGA
ncbi:MAG: BREX-2 system phosphatase PglZ [Pseudomonadota bacterium]